MNQDGLLADFLVCKIGVAIAALALLGAVLTMSSGLKRAAEREDLAIFADTITGAIQTVERTPGEVELRRTLPALAQQTEVAIIGELSDGIQVIRIVVGSGERVEHTLMLGNQVNGGEFSLSHESPSAIRLSKTGEIRLELV
jgi:hypothetical protein